jgi:hypothetical protein
MLWEFVHPSFANRRRPDCPSEWLRADACVWFVTWSYSRLSTLWDCCHVTQFSLIPNSSCLL